MNNFEKMIKLPGSIEEKDLSKRLKSIGNYYLRGAITKKEFNYLLTQVNYQKDIDDYIEFLLDMLEEGARRERTELMKKVIEKALERL